MTRHACFLFMLSFWNPCCWLLVTKLLAANQMSRKFRLSEFSLNCCCVSEPKEQGSTNIVRLMLIYYMGVASAAA